MESIYSRVHWARVWASTKSRLSRAVALKAKLWTRLEKASKSLSVCRIKRLAKSWWNQSKSRRGASLHWLPRITKLFKAKSQWVRLSQCTTIQVWWRKRTKIVKTTLMQSDRQFWIGTILKVKSKWPRVKLSNLVVHKALLLWAHQPSFTRRARSIQMTRLTISTQESNRMYLFRKVIKSLPLSSKYLPKLFLKKAISNKYAKPKELLLFPKSLAVEIKMTACLKLTSISLVERNFERALLWAFIDTIEMNINTHWINLNIQI